MKKRGSQAHKPNCQCNFCKGKRGELIGTRSEHNAPNWKGDEAGYLAMHRWVETHLGKASEHKCVDCNKQAEQWSNKDHTYKRVLEDYSPRCTKCHFAYDKKFNGTKVGRRVGSGKPDVPIICQICLAVKFLRPGKAKYQKTCSPRCARILHFKLLRIKNKGRQIKYKSRKENKKI